MCGIAGMIAAEAARPVDEGRLWESARLLHHRGPDGSNVWTEPGLGLSHTRLAIIDRAHGEQPMFSADERYVVVFNGEIYNHHQLRRDLEARGYRLRTRCDTEVLLYMYDWLGDRMVERLRGMFAFMVFDRRERRALLARDRFGKKPLYYSDASGLFCFASTLDTLISLLETRPELDVGAITQYLVLQYIPSPLSPYQGVAKLSPGHLVSWSNGRFDVRRYWRPPSRSDRKDRTDPREEVRRVRELIGEAVKIRLESEVPLGVFLSGGLDSSVVVAEMSSAGVRPKTYSVGFHDTSYDETRYARLVADRFETDHQELMADQDVQSVFHDFVTHYDEPFADSSALATLAVARAASDHVTVILTGDGGDELFGGYLRYQAFRRAVRIRQSLGPFSAVAGVAAELMGGVAGWKRLRTGGRLVRDPWKTYRDGLFHFHPHDLEGLLRPEVLDSVHALEPIERLDRLWRETSRNLTDLLWIDEQTYLADDLLTKMDRATMAHGLEARSPLLDHALAEQCACLPEKMLFEGSEGKTVLRSAYAAILPRQVLHRPKMGFGVPIGRWMRGGLRADLEQLLLSDSGPLWPFLQRKTVSRLVNTLMAGRDGESRRVWNLLALAAWARPRLRS